MIEVEVGVDDDRNVGRLEASLADGVFQSRRLTLVFYPVCVAELLVVFVADPGVYQDQSIPGLHQDAAHRQRDPVPLIGCDLLFPERLGHDAEHSAAVQVHPARIKRV